ncbi:MAG: hypothetical protein AAGA85_27325, partial [Bacteroidota bacterium]
LLLDGNPLPNQLVYADYITSANSQHDHEHEGEEHSHEHEGEEHSHDHDGEEHSHEHDGEEHTHTSGQQLRTNDQGIVEVDLPEDGIYYLRTISMVAISGSDELTHESKWATLTFEVTHKHDSSTHTHHDHFSQATDDHPYHNDDHFFSHITRLWARGSVEAACESSQSNTY